MILFVSVSYSVAGLGLAASPFCRHIAGHYQQKLPTTNVSHLLAQIGALRLLKSLGTIIKFDRPIDTNSTRVQFSCLLMLPALLSMGSSVLLPPSFLVISNVMQSSELFFTQVLLFGQMKWRSWNHCSWRGDWRGKGPCQDIQHTNRFQSPALEYYWLQGPLRLMSTQRSSFDSSARTDMNVIWYNFKTNAMSRLIWIPLFINAASGDKNTASPVTHPAQVMLCSGRLP